MRNDKLDVDIEVIDRSPERFQGKGGIIGRRYVITSSVYANRDDGYVRDWFGRLPSDVQEVVFWMAQVIVQAKSWEDV